MDIISVFAKLINIINGISTVIGYFFKHKVVYKYTGLFFTRKFHKAKNNHTYGILVSAREEEAVIGKLIESIKNQDYPQELIKIFVVAHNCEDGTAEAARAEGAITYEFNDPTKKTKGYALQYLVEQIRRDYGIDCCEGYMIFDADNLLKEDFITRMNESFDAGEKIVTSYRNTKNFDDNWISASYGIHWLRTVRYEHRARSIFHLAGRVQGTGFLFPWEVIKDGWNYTSLTEDRAFCADVVTKGYKISYNNRAEFFDEQPTDIKIAMRQRLRWSRGHLDAFAETGGKLFLNIFRTKGAGNKFTKEGTPWWKRVIYNIRFRFINFDMLTIVYPRTILLSLKKLVVVGLKIGCILTTTRVFQNLPSFFNDINRLFGIKFDLSGTSDGSAIFWMCLFTFLWTVSTYIENIFRAAYVLIAERRRIKKIKWYKKVWYCLTFPIFDLIGKLTMIMALFTRIEWKPIPHKVAVDLKKMREG